MIDVKSRDRQLESAARKLAEYAIHVASREAELAGSPDKADETIERVIEAGAAEYPSGEWEQVTELARAEVEYRKLHAPRWPYLNE